VDGWVGRWVGERAGGSGVGARTETADGVDGASSGGLQLRQQGRNDMNFTRSGQRGGC
jgi:hypothetical protein